MNSPQTLSEADRRIVAAWAADCAARVLAVFEAEAPADSRPRDAIARTRAYSRGELDTAAEIRRRFVADRAARDVRAPAAVAAARAAAQASAVAHMGAHALGAAAYAAKAAGLAAPHRPEALSDEMRSLRICPRQPEWPCDSCRQSVRIRQARSVPACFPPAFSAPSSANSKRG